VVIELVREREREDQQGKRSAGFCLRRRVQDLRDFGEYLVAEREETKLRNFVK
jgi:hypothetical protein